MYRLALFLILVFVSLEGYAQTYYVAIIHGEVYYNNKPLKKRDKITLEGTLRFSSAEDYVKVSGPGGLHTVRPDGRRANRRNEFLVAVREELFPPVRMRATVAQGMIDDGRRCYFGFNGNGGDFFFPQVHKIDTDRLAEAQDFGLLHATADGLVWQSLPLQDSTFTLDSLTFDSRLKIERSAVVLVRDSTTWVELIEQHRDQPMDSLWDSVNHYCNYYPDGVEAFVLQWDSLRNEWVDPAPPPVLSAEILDYMRPYHFVNPQSFFEDMRFHIQQSGAHSSEEFLHNFFYDEYVQEAYGEPQGYYKVIEALVPEPYTGYSSRWDAWYQQPLRVGIVGLVHTHVHWLLGREDRGDIQIVGIVEPNRELATRYCEQYGLSMDKVYDTMEELMAFGNPDAVTGFNTTYDHLALVEYFAPRGVDIMVEKPLAVNLEHAERMVALAKKHGVQLLTNYETSWYASNAHAYKLLQDSTQLGDLTRLIFYTGHQGPIEIGCNQEFLDWLTDPKLNGGGALPDFACYGANLTTWLLQGQAPLDVTCITRQTKPQLYPQVEDDATIILNYPNQVQVLIQASWNWSHNRKEMELYATGGYVFCRDGQRMEQLLAGEEEVQTLQAAPLPEAVNDPFAYFFAVVKQGQEVAPWDVSAPENNLRVMQILEAAKRSAEEGRTVKWGSAPLTPH